MKKTTVQKYFLTFLFSLFSIFFPIFSISAQSPPKREFRAAWIATVGNIDWPSKRGLSASQQQQEFINHLNFLQSHGFNAVIVQIRPAADAFYPSNFEPWSQYLTGKQGLPPFPNYDPLLFMIKETHKRNMEFHAWFNPYRALVNSAVNPNPASHVTKRHPDWLIHFGGKSYFDPGNPDARNYILNVLLDVVKRYNIDGVHIDDYFYPYPMPGKVFNDKTSFNKYNNGMSLDDWRRNNVNLFISQLYTQIKKEKYWVKFGVSPFGIWRNQKNDIKGSATSGTSCYDDLYSDIKLWIDNKWVDYIAPQLYWENGHRVAPFEILLPWWAQNKGERHLYIGLGLYRMVGAKSEIWKTPQEILRQISMTRQQETEGIVFYSISNFSKINNDLEDSLSQTYFRTIAIPPAMPWLKSFSPPQPTLQVKIAENGNFLTWEVPENKLDLKYLVYRFEDGEKINLNHADKIIALTQAQSFLDRSRTPKKRYVYIVSSLDRLWNESAPSSFELN